jgi:hypothetical protein
LVAVFAALLLALVLDRFGRPAPALGALVVGFGQCHTMGYRLLL